MKVPAMTTLLRFLVAWTLSMPLALTGHATLFDRGGGLIYDSDLDIIWLKNGNHAQTSGYTNPAVAGVVVCGRRSHC